MADCSHPDQRGSRPTAERIRSRTGNWCRFSMNISDILHNKICFFGKWADDSGISLCCCHRRHDNTLQTRYDNIKVWKPEPWIKPELAADHIWHQWGEGHWKNKHALLSTYAKPCYMWPDWHLTCPYIDATTFHVWANVNKHICRASCGWNCSCWQDLQV